jgi:hypothetical protein
MDPQRARARIAGLLFVIATVANIVGTGLSRSFLGDAARLTALSANATQVTAGALLELIAAGACVGIAVSLYPVIRESSSSLALGSVVFRAIEAVMYTVAVVSLLTLLALSGQFVSANDFERASIQAAGDSLVALREQAGLISVLPFSVGAFMYYWIFFRSQLVPRWLSVSGLSAIILLLTAWLLALFGHTSMLSYMYLVLPLAVQEMVLAIWLMIKGFNARAPVPLNSNPPLVHWSGAQRIGP